MIDFSMLPAFLLATFFLVIAPGPDMLLISTYSSTRGFRSGWMISMGIFIAGLIQTILVAFGLGRLMQAVPPLALAVKLIGAVYLSWLGIKLLKAWFKNRDTASASSIARSLTPKELILQGLFNNLTNPKALIFFSMFLPQFTTAALDYTPQILCLGTTLTCTAFFINIVLSLWSSRLGSFLGRKFSISRHIDGILGMIFLGLAARLATSK